MPRSPRRPKPIEVHPIRARVVRGPHKDGTGRWYWRAEVPDPGNKPRTIWTGWAHPKRVADRLAELRENGAHRRELPRRAIEAPDGYARKGTVHRLLQEWLADRAERIVARERGVKRPRGSITQSTWDNYRSKCRHLVRHLGDRSTRGIQRGDLDDYRRARQEDGRARPSGRPTEDSTLNAELRILSMAWTWGRRDGFSEAWDLPMSVGTTRASRPRVTPSREDVARVAAVLEGWPRTMFVLLANTGARVGTLARLRWRDVDLDEGWIEVDGKSGPQRSGLRRVPLLDEALEELRATRPDDPRPDARVLGVAFTTARCFSHDRLRPACERAGLDDDRQFTAHGLRRFAVDELCRAGVAPEVVASALGHSIAVMLEIYRQVRPDELVAGFQRAQLGTREPKVLPFPRSGTD